MYTQNDSKLARQEWQIDNGEIKCTKSQALNLQGTVLSHMCDVLAQIDNSDWNDDETDRWKWWQDSFYI